MAAIVAGCTSAYADYTIEPMDVPKIDGIVIDGDAADWLDRGFRVEVMSDDRGGYRLPDDFDPRLRIGWDGRGLLLLINVTDDHAQEHGDPRRMFLADSIELFVGSQRGFHDYYMLLIGPGCDPDHPEPRHVFFDERGGGPAAAEGLKPLDATIARTHTDNGYRIEVLLPWDNLEIQPREGATLAFQVYAMDKDNDAGIYSDTFRVAWFPRFDTHQNQTTSMYELRLGATPDEPVQTAVAGYFRDVKITAVEKLAGMKVRVTQGDTTLAEGRLNLRDGRAVTSLKIPVEDPGNQVGSLDVYINNQLVARTLRGGSAEMLAEAIEEGDLTFRQYVFSGPGFPQVEFDNPRVIRSLIETPDIHARFFNAEFEEVTAASEPGRYGAVVEITPKHGRMTRRFFTLYRTPNDKPVPTPAMPPHILPDLMAITLTEGAVLHADTEDRAGYDVTEAAAIRRSTPIQTTGQEGPLSFDSAKLADQRWWVQLRRRLYDLDEQPAALPMPIPLEEAPAITLRDGSPQEAGLDPAVISKLEAICAEWIAANNNQGVAVCVARHGVVFFHQAYGQTPEGVPMTVDTPAGISSLTKMITGILLMLYVDRGLVDLDAPLDRYIPALRDIKVATPMTHRMLLTHTSGLATHYGGEPRDLEERIADEYGFVNAPVAHLYDGAGYALSVKALEGISNEPFPVLYQRLLFNPLGMKHTAAYDTHSNMVSTASDLAKLGQMLLNGGAYGDWRFLQPKTVEQAKPVRLNMILEDDTEKIWGVGIWGDKPMIRHLGGTAFGHPSANSTYLRIDTATDLVLAVSSLERTRFFAGDLRTRFIRTIENSIQSSTIP